ncbi:50S ribosomal protein L10 [Mycoplasmopsis gallinarum]|uniref:50S ribosomal protein L10 n=1 Tax=Mycoplasmopsis gallinarum TaxID=29557 RepID=UPI0004861680|nr:50S ribosomal protein L10 [Mycoplasmopsis gallinarum]
MSVNHKSALRIAKEQTVQEIKDLLSSKQTLLVAEYRGLSVAELTKLRVEAKKQNLQVKVFKNRLLKLAAKELNIDLDQFLTGPNLFIFGDDTNAVFKLGVSFAKENKLFVNKAGIYEQNVIDAKGVQEVATLPNYEEALTILARSLMSPLQQLSLSLKMFSEKE